VRLLLDTHLLLWAAASSKRLPREARELMEDDSNDVYYSAARI
jgi:PIN domain nuclease of toxin-antitoxin system